MTVPWSAKRKYDGSSPCSRRTTILVERQFHKYVQSDQNVFQDPSIFGMNPLLNVGKSSLSIGCEDLKSNSPQSHLQISLEDQQCNEDIISDFTTITSANSFEARDSVLCDRTSESVLREIDLNVHVDHAKCNENSKYPPFSMEGKEVFNQGLKCSLINYEATARRKVRKVIDLYEELLVKNFKVVQLEMKGVRVNSNIYMVVAKLLQKQHMWIKADRRFGSIPGIEVGDKFRYRAELFLIGLHCQFRNGIDYLAENENMLATSIVHSSRYENEISESFDVLIYSGHGGNPNVSVNALGKDQKLEKGNMALRNNIRTRDPVRVIYGSKPQAWKKYTLGLDSSEEHISTYTYIGLYSVDEFWQERGQFGKLVFKFLLRRLPEKPQLILGKEDRREEEKAHKGDINLSEGKENMPIRVVNGIDNKQPPSFNYISDMIYPNLRDHSFPRGCNCFDGCCDSSKCYCAGRNNCEGAISYQHGLIVKFKPLIYECGPCCQCSSCPNRVSQHGIKFQLEVFRSKTKGWGVRSRDHIPCGSFICEYVGEVFHESEVDRRVGKEKYLFDIGRFSNGSDIIYSCSDRQVMPKTFEGFTIDATHFGNVARFLNHSNDSNVRAQYVLYDHADKRMPHVMLFATKNIPPMKELTYSSVMR